ncbi:hypothetical protein Zm00014a_017195 [Zea mays]|uniref:Uncharacterized protein n=1 Tax=Zea mays TaxID=4577 RepID=A0A3L6EXD5_MAIZE|nr:hypothetical protein Zm00014a_017195 [Zea mays]
MRSSVCERSLIIESDDDDDDHPQSRSSAAARSRRRHHQQEEDSAAGSDSDSGSSSSSCGTPRGPATDSSYTQQWPQSYRQSIDILSGVQSPNLSFLGNGNPNSKQIVQLFSG